MGTRARINIIEDKPIVSIYRHYDGSPSGLGLAVAKFAAKVTIVNGISSKAAMGEMANGIGCFAAQLIKALKDDVGNVYIRDTSQNSHGEEYAYDVYEKDGKIWIDVFEGHMTAFGMPGDKQSDMTPIFSGFAEDLAEKLSNTDQDD
jgi:hypothetical protein